MKIANFDNKTTEVTIKQMLIRFILPFVILLLLLACSDPGVSAEKTGSIEGIVFDGSSELAISKARVITTPPTFSVTTDTTGSYEITNVEPGIYRVNAAKFGYDSTGVNVSVSEGIVTTADIPLLSDSLSI